MGVDRPKNAQVEISKEQLPKITKALNSLNYRSMQYLLLILSLSPRILSLIIMIHFGSQMLNREVPFILGTYTLSKHLSQTWLR